MKTTKLPYIIVALILFTMLYFTGVLPVIIATDQNTGCSAFVQIDEAEIVNLSDSFEDSISSITLYFQRRQYNNLTTLYKYELESTDFGKLELEVTGGDMATVTNSAWIINAEGVYTKLKMAVDGVIGIQSESLGWLEFTQQDSIQQMMDNADPVFMPVVVL